MVVTTRQQMRALAAGGDINSIVGCYGETRLTYAALKGDFSMIDLLLQHGADPNAIQGSTSIVEVLLKYGAAIDATDRNGWMPLHNATIQESTSIVETLLKYKANVNAVVTLGWTPVHFAATLGYTKILNILLNYGADVNAVTGDTPLDFISTYFISVPKILKMVLKQGVSGMLVDYLHLVGMTPTNIAIYFGHQDIQNILTNHLTERAVLESLRALRGKVPADIACTIVKQAFPLKFQDL